ncbi:hypothetical protein TNCV_730431 [Trichonephila clavipes]|nr:hypothetical protein TNCV_730431 [Trichonephila clavipes]
MYYLSGVFGEQRHFPGAGRHVALRSFSQHELNKRRRQDEVRNFLEHCLPTCTPSPLMVSAAHRDNGTGRKQWNGPPLVPSLSFTHYRVLGALERERDMGECPSYILLDEILQKWD